jgi:hypothetical protein
MTAMTANKLLNIVNTLEGMLNEVGAKQTLLRNRIKDCKNRRELDAMKNTTVILGSEIDNINVTLGLLEDLHDHLGTVAA